MSVLTDFLATDSVMLDPIGLNVIDPVYVVIAGVRAPDPAIPAGPLTRTVPCIPKVPGNLNVTLNILGLAIAFTGMPVGMDRMGRPLVRWSVNDRTRRPFMGATILNIQGNMTTALAPLEPLRTDLMTCVGAAAEFFVTLTLVPPEEVGETFGRPPNEILLETDLTTPVRASITNVRGDAGAASPPPTPWPQPAWITTSTLCVNSARSTSRVTVEVRLDRPVLRSHSGFACLLTAEAVEPPRLLEVREHPIVIGSSAVYRDVILPPDLTGEVRVTAFTNDRSRSRSARFFVSGPGLSPCSDRIDVPKYEPIPVGCEAYDCDWTTLNDIAELIGRSGGWAVRYRTTRRTIDPIGRLLGELASLRAMNNRGRVVGVVDHGSGKSEGFIYGEPEKEPDGPPELHLIPGVSFHALNNANVAVGSRFDGTRAIPVRWTDGKLEEIDVKSKNAIALAINNIGDIAGVHEPEEGGSLRAFVFNEKGFHDLGTVWGDVTTVVMNDSGLVAGTYLNKQVLRGFIYTPDTGLSDLKTPIDFGQCVVRGINNAGVVVGIFKDDQSDAMRPFRFTKTRGMEDLNNFIDSNEKVTLEAAIAINSLGQILAVGERSGARGYFLLNPSSIPPPQLPVR
jgi:hypothetical protein